MTFEQWWALNSKALLTYAANGDVKSAQRYLAGCWNAALDEAARWIAAPEPMTEETRLMVNALRVTPIEGEMQKFSQ